MAAINDKHSKSTRAGSQIKKQADPVSASKYMKQSNAADLAYHEFTTHQIKEELHIQSQYQPLSATA